LCGGQAGDPITCYSYNNEALGSAVITDIVKTDNCCCEGATCSLWGNKAPLNKMRASRVTLDVWPEAFSSAGENCYLENWGCQGSGFLILNNTLEWTRARGMMLKCCNGSIIGNNCKGVHMSRARGLACCNVGLVTAYALAFLCKKAPSCFCFMRFPHVRLGLDVQSMVVESHCCPFPFHLLTISLP
jgi:hypothetical protein